MLGNWNIGVVIPARNEEEHLPKVLETIPDFVDNVVVVDDGSTDTTASIAKNFNLVKLNGQGVGAAIDAGHQKLLQIFEGKFVSVVIAGDGQMDLRIWKMSSIQLSRIKHTMSKEKELTEKERCL